MRSSHISYLRRDPQDPYPPKPQDIHFLRILSAGARRHQASAPMIFPPGMNVYYAYPSSSPNDVLLREYMRSSQISYLRRDPQDPHTPKPQDIHVLHIISAGARRHQTSATMLFLPGINDLMSSQHIHERISRL